MSAEISISEATIADVNALVGLMRDFYAESGFPLDPAWAAESFRMLLADPSRGRVWLVRAGETAVGHVVLSLRFTMEHGGLSGSIDDLYVTPEHRRKGCGRKLLTSLAAHCREMGCKSLQVEVAESNDAALALYRAFGLEVIRDGRVLAAVKLEGFA